MSSHVNSNFTSLTDYAQNNVISEMTFKGRRFYSVDALSKLLVERSAFNKTLFPHFSFVQCAFEDCTFDEVTFRLVVQSKDELNAIGSLFLDCVFKRCQIRKCNFVMSTIRKTKFNQCTIINCDFRNVTWMDRFLSKTGKWIDSQKLDDPFETSKLKRCRFGHPLGNIMSLPKEMMLPPSYSSIWSHISEPQRSFLRVSYMMGDSPESKFSSAI